MTEASDGVCPLTPATEAAWAGVSMAFAALGRIFICLDSGFRVLHASHMFDGLVGDGCAARAAGRPVAELLGEDLFGPEGSLRRALASGERREGWRALLGPDCGEPKLVSLTVAPFPRDPGGVCDPRVAYVLVLRPADDEETPQVGAPLVFHGMVARSEAMFRVFRLVQTLEPSEATVLLGGESGTGKERMARAIHACSPRREGPFVAVSCAALPGELLESELFGHARGAFTGAVRDRVGRFELAQSGTLFLDEIGDLSMALQVKLLRVLQERSFERVGESRPRPADARIIAATHVDLRRAVQEGRFRDDLYYRLRVVPIELPPLRARREDIEPLATHLLAHVGARLGRALRFSPDALRALLDYSWPGNVRELENAIEYAVAVGRGQTILPEDLPAELLPRPSRPAASPRFEAPAAGPHAADQSDEAARLRAALERFRWRRDEAARALGISRSTLWRRMRELGLAER